jgi:hypothetical protein
MLFLTVAWGAMRSTAPATSRPGMASTSTSTSMPCFRRVTSAWLTWALITMELRSAMVSTSVPELKPPDPETACPMETGRVRTVQSKGATMRVRRRRSLARVEFLLAAFDRVAGEVVVLDRGVVALAARLEHLFRDEFLLVELLVAFVVAPCLFHRQACLVQLEFAALDLLFAAFGFDAEVPVVEGEEQATLLDQVADIDREFVDLAVDLRTDGDLFGGPDFARDAHGETDAASLDGCGGLACAGVLAAG